MCTYKVQERLLGYDKHKNIPIRIVTCAPSLIYWSFVYAYYQELSKTI